MYFRRHISESLFKNIKFGGLKIPKISPEKQLKIPDYILERLHFKNEQEVTIDTEQNRIVITPVLHEQPKKPENGDFDFKSRKYLKAMNDQKRRDEALSMRYKHPILYDLSYEKISQDLNEWLWFRVFYCSR